MKNEDFLSSISSPGEDWKFIPGFGNLYVISTLGRIVRLNMSYKQGGRVYKRACKLVSQRIGNNGYYTVTLSKDGRFSPCYVHRLIAIAFIPNPNNLPYINHKDEDKLNNSIDNLEWCTTRYNCNYGTRNFRMRKALVNDTKTGKPVIQLSKTGAIITTYKSISEAARKTGIHDSTICRCCSGVIKSGRKFRWMYLSDYESQVSMAKNS